MARLNSFHLPAALWPLPGANVVLSGPEARHMLAVLRLAPGQTVRLFDGAGQEGLFAIQNATKHQAELTPLSQSSSPRPGQGLVLALGWNKAARRDWIIEKSVELGALGLWFWRARRSQGEPPETPKPSWTDKCLQAAKQCGATWIPELRTFGTAGELAGVAAEFTGCYLLWEEASQATLIDPQALGTGRNLLVLGPEGGLDEAEAQRFQEAGFLPASLGPRPLRWETAALHCLSLAYHASLDNPQPA